MTHHSLEYGEGQQAYYSGNSLVHNPYQAGTTEHDDWRNGYAAETDLDKWEPED